MNILAIETSLGAQSVAVMTGGAIVERGEPRETARAETLVLLVRLVLAEAGIRFQDLDLVAACTGPGSFTSVRTGLAAARGIAVAAGKSLVGATSLEVIAAELVAQGLIDDRFAVALDARKDEIYLEMFSADGCPTAAPTLVGATATPPGLTIAAGPGGHILAGWIGGIGRAARIVGPDIVPTAGRLARMAPTLPRHGRASPVYLRAADAKPPAPSTLLGRAP